MHRCIVTTGADSRSLQPTAPLRNSSPHFRRGCLSDFLMSHTYPECDSLHMMPIIVRACCLLVPMKSLPLIENVSEPDFLPSRSGFLGGYLCTFSVAITVFDFCLSNSLAWSLNEFAFIWNYTERILWHLLVPCFVYEDSSSENSTSSVLVPASGVWTDNRGGVQRVILQCTGNCVASESFDLVM